ncbi:MAG: trehalase family glycosidase [candidate division FCPU426 bacterium]
MKKPFLDPYYPDHVPNALVAQNRFVGAARERKAPPSFKAAKALLPQPHWDGHASAIDCYWKSWELAFGNIRRPTRENGFVSNYIDTAFNDHLFMWDSAFILLFARYGSRAFDFQKTLDNFYAKQLPDGFICRQIRESDGGDIFHRFDPSATGPNVMPWTEWEYFKTFGDKARLKKIFPALAAFHQWMKAYRSWPGGGYWATGWACGMDNQPRIPKRYNQEWYHGKAVWADTTLQQLFSARLLAQMAAVLGREEAREFKREEAELAAFVRAKLWDPKTAFYYDRLEDGKLSGVKSIGAFWAMLAGVLPASAKKRFVAHLENPREFKRPHRVPSLSFEQPEYKTHGGYWLGGVWPNTNYMVLRGLSGLNEDALAHEIAMNHHGHVTQMFEKTGTVFENYAPEYNGKGKPAKADFVGWSGLGPIAVLFEYVFGLRADVPSGRLVWDLRLLEGHGVKGYPFAAKGLLDLSVAPRASAKEKPQVKASANMRLKLEIRWEGGKELRQL